ncbi:unnamed protein product [Closterium sp. Naga37s-1]|nr:unnamed protein product [Closterium sp. Naga37s-1]
MSLYRAWEAAYRLQADSPLPPSAIALPPRVPPPPHLEDCVALTAWRWAQEQGEAGEGGKGGKAGSRGEDGDVGEGKGEASGKTGKVGAEKKGESGEGLQGMGGRGELPPWAAQAHPQPPWILGSDAANLAMTRVAQRDIWAHQFPPGGDCSEDRLLLVDWPSSPQALMLPSTATSSPSSPPPVNTELSCRSSQLSPLSRLPKLRSPLQFPATGTFASFHCYFFPLVSPASTGTFGSFHCYFFPLVSPACEHEAELAVAAAAAANETLPRMTEDSKEAVLASEQRVVLFHGEPYNGLRFEGDVSRWPNAYRERPNTMEVVGFVGEGDETRQRVRWSVLGCPGVCWGVLGCAGVCWGVLGCAGACWGVLGCPGVHWWRGGPVHPLPPPLTLCLPLPHHTTHMYLNCLSTPTFTLPLLPGALAAGRPSALAAGRPSALAAGRPSPPASSSAHPLPTSATSHHPHVSELPLHPHLYPPPPPRCTGGGAGPIHPLPPPLTLCLPLPHHINQLYLAPLFRCTGGGAGSIHPLPPPLPLCLPLPHQQPCPPHLSQPLYCPFTPPHPTILPTYTSPPRCTGGGINPSVSFSAPPPPTSATSPTVSATPPTASQLPPTSPPPPFPPHFLFPLTSSYQVHWWRAQSIRFLLRFPSSYLCHITNRVRHTSYGLSVAAHLSASAAQQAALAHTHPEILSLLRAAAPPCIGGDGSSNSAGAAGMGREAAQQLQL